MALQVDSDHLPRGGQVREDGAEHVDGTEAAVKEQEGLALPMNFVVVIEPVGRDMT